MRSEKRLSRTVGLLVTIILVSSCAPKTETAHQMSEEVTKPPGGEIRFAQLFEARECKGSFLLYDLNEDSYVRYDAERCAQQFLPASTFKVFNALVALETGVIADEDAIIPWDGTQHDYGPWNQDHTLRTGMKHSVVWFFQELARRAGRERMQHYVDVAGYGNRDISGGIDTFWLEGGLRISPEEQVAFLRKLYAGDLPFSERTMDIVRDIIVLEETDKYRLSGKTGTVLRVESRIGWFVGYLEREGNVYFFATNVEQEESAESLGGVISLEITRQVLEEMGLLEQQ
jgi:beta-lactamase class D